MKLTNSQESLTKSFIEALNEDTIPWRKEWKISDIGMPYNASNNTMYHGVNVLILWQAAALKGYSDPRWCTFKQANDNGWKIKAGEKGTVITKYSWVDKNTKRCVSINDVREIIDKDPDRKDDFYFAAFDLSRFPLFNAEQISGIPELEKPLPTTDIEMNKKVEQMIENIKVGYREFGDSAYYSYNGDSITMPPRNSFSNELSFNATLLHEISHSTMHETRLDRKDGHIGRFGSESYAKEELRAEIASAFLSARLNYDVVNNTLDNHKAYIQSWSKVLKKNPDELIKAITEADKIANYLEKNIEAPVKELAKVESLEEKLSKAQQKAAERNAMQLGEKTLNKDFMKEQ